MVSLSANLSRLTTKKDAMPPETDSHVAPALSPDHPLILLTGATGYVGGRLLTRLEEEGHRVRCLTRRPDELLARAGGNTSAVYADMLDMESLATAMEGGDVAYYLVHSMGLGEGFEEKDRRAARNFGEAARAAGVRRIIYLGGLGEERMANSPHLRSRREVGEVLRESGVQVIEFRASVVLGSGSLSFELIRALVERLPVMIAPRWVAVTTQPIGIVDLLAYLVAAAELPGTANKVYEIGGADQVSFGQLMKAYARQRSLRRTIIPVPLLTPRLSSLWLGLVTPVYARVGRKLIESMTVPTVVRDPSAQEDFSIRPQGVEQAIARAIVNEDRQYAATQWFDALSSSGDTRDMSSARFGSRLVDSRTIRVAATPTDAFSPISRIGGRNGWYYGTWLWHVRGFIDLLVGGVGMRRGRLHPTRFQVGEAVDWWRVEAIEPGKRVRLFAEMKVPGRAWLEFDVEQEGTGSSIRQTAIFDPVGLAGLAYWYATYPVHQLMFGGMLKEIGKQAEAAALDAAQRSAPRA
jgi:uncharacterized protein YbjT (DUF2867 family)